MGVDQTTVLDDEKVGLWRAWADTLGAGWSPWWQPTSKSLEAEKLKTSSDDALDLVWHRYDNAWGSRDYAVHVPTRKVDQPLPLVVMLHGCKQTAEDFARGTGLNRLADEESPCIVVYPQQASRHHALHCWRWFEPEHQRRDEGEPALLAGLTLDVMQRYAVDPTRVYIAGLSAGGAMAAVMARTYPDIFAAAGVHAGLPYAVARDIPSALAAMRGGKPAEPWMNVPPAGVPLIVFHGTEDQTVHPTHARGLIESEHPTASERAQTYKIWTTDLPARCTVFRSPEGRVVAEQWEVIGLPHAWSGGDPGGTYTDPRGPDAGREMLRFFAGHRRP